MNTVSPEKNQQKTASFEAAFGAYPSMDTSTRNLRGSNLVRDSGLSSNTTLSSNSNLVKGSGDAGNRTPGTWLDRPVPDQLIPTPYSSYHLLAITLLAIFVLIPPAYVVGRKAFAPAPETISPLSEISSFPSSQPSHRVYTSSDYLYLSQRYFTDAQMLSQNRQQTEEQKKEIIATLQKAIDTISEGISLYPNIAELWTQRANIYMAIRTILPAAEQAAVADIQEAQRLSQHSSSPSSPSSPSFPSGLELIKDQQALRGSGQTSRDVIVAAPDEGTSPYADTKESSAITGTAVIPAGQLELAIAHTHVTDASPVYVVPKTQTSGVLTVIKKIAGSGFTVALDNPQTTDTLFQYWITR